MSLSTKAITQGKSRQTTDNEQDLPTEHQDLWLGPPCPETLTTCPRLITNLAILLPHKCWD